MDNGPRKIGDRLANWLFLVVKASTSTKNPDYVDTLYVDELIGPDTVNTIPPATLDSFMDHGKVAETLTRDGKQAREQIAKLAQLGPGIRKQ